MLNQRFRAIYMAAIIVFFVGVFGIVTVPNANGQLNQRPAAVSTEPSIQQRLFNSYKPLMSFATLGLLSSIGLALLYSKGKA